MDCTAHVRAFDRRGLTGIEILPAHRFNPELFNGEYEVIEDSLGSLPIRYWVYSKDRENALRSFRKTPEIISFFNRKFGFPYPWSKYDQITIPGIGGGAECTSATLIGQGVIHDERADQDFPTHWLVAHEAAHQWWGDLITLRDWGHTWINESFGTYFEYLFTRYDLGDDEGAVNLQDKKNTYLNEARNRYIRPIVFHRWNTPNENFDRHTYQKGAAVIHMLRWILGDEPFRKTLSHFLRKFAFKPAGTHDFLTAVREVTGRNLDWFFEQWLSKDDSYLARAEAVRAIGKCGSPSSKPLLHEALNMKSPRNVMKRAAEWAVKEIGMSESDR